MLIAVTGATGFIGRYIVNHLLEADHRCRCWYRHESDRGGFVPAAEQNVEWVGGQLGDPEAAERLVDGVDAVVHSALWRPGRGWSGSEGRVSTFAEINVMGTLQLFEAAAAQNLHRFVSLSTCAVHELILEDRPLDEAHPLWPTSHYGAHKAAIEKFVHSFGLSGQLPVCALRPTGVYGVNRPVERSKWFSLIQDVIAGKPVQSPRGGKEVHAADVAKAVDLLLHAEPDQVVGQAFNCYDRYIADQEVAQIAKELAGSDSQIELLNKGPKHQIRTEKIQSLGMSFGGEALLRETVGQLVKQLQATPASQ